MSPLELTKFVFINLNRNRSMFTSPDMEKDTPVLARMDVLEQRVEENSSKLSEIQSVLNAIYEREFYNSVEKQKSPSSVASEQRHLNTETFRLEEEQKTSTPIVVGMNRANLD